MPPLLTAIERFKSRMCVASTFHSLHAPHSRSHPSFLPPSRAPASSMHSPLVTLSALLACLLGSTFVAVAAAAGTTPNVPVCLSACVTSPTEQCKDLVSKKELWRGPVSLHGVRSANGVKYRKKTVWWRQVVGGNWFGAHVLQDGSMNMWSRGETAKGKMYVYGFHLSNGAGHQETHYYWLRGLDTCRSARGSFTEYDGLSSVSILEQ